MNADKIGKFIQEMRKKRGMTQTDLANKINVTNKAVSKWERGLGFPDITLIEVLANELNVSITELMRGQLLSDEDTIDKNDVEMLLKTELTLAKKHSKKSKIILISSFSLLILIFSIYFISNIEHIYKTFFEKGYSEIFRFSVFGLIPFDELYNLIYIPNTVTIDAFVKNILINVFVSILISISLLFFVNQKKKYLKITIFLNIILEFLKWIFAYMSFDSDDILIRILTGIVFIFFWEKFLLKRIDS